MRPVSTIAFCGFAFLIVPTIFIFSSKPHSSINPSLKSSSSRRHQVKEGRLAMTMAGSGIPPLLYGTAWKKERTQELVELAITTGFRGVDTACQPKHYFEPGVGEALKTLYSTSIVSRKDIFLQTKFTPFHGQDPNDIPYDPRLSLREQVRQSFAVSCKNLATEYLDSLVLHSPLPSFEETMEVWYTFEDIHKNGGAVNLGISNIYDLNLLQRIFDAANVKPAFVQNRFYQKSGYDKAIRDFCRTSNIVYQSFWTLTANPHVLTSSTVRALASKYGKTNEQIMFSFMRANGITVLTGTKSQEHMLQDLETLSVDLTPAEVSDMQLLLK